MVKNRRNFIGKSALGVFGLFSFSTSLYSNNNYPLIENTNLPQDGNGISPLYPTQDYEIVREVVGAAHARFDRVKELVTERPELAKATWDWGFGDVETALGAASHMGRKDIAEFLIEYGARPDIYTFAMLGKMNAVKAMIEDMPGLQRINGPHGFTLIHHAKIRLMRKNVEGEEKEKQETLVAYLESLGDANIRAKSLDISEKEQKTYIGKYTFGNGKDEWFEVKLNRQKTLSMARGDNFGRALLKVDEHTFAPGGAPSVRIKFDVTDGVAKAVTVHDPTPIVKATRI